MMSELKEAFYRVGLAMIIFAGSLLLSAALVVSGIMLEQLVSFAVGDESTALKVVKVVLDVSLVGSAVVVAVCGAIIVATESIKSTLIFIGSEGRS